MAHDTSYAPRAPRAPRVPRPPRPPEAEAPRSGASSEAADRGSLTLSDRAVEKIAGQCAAEIDGVGGHAGGLFGVGRHHDLQARPQVDVELTGRIASLTVRLGLRYPAPIAETTEHVREVLRRRVTALAGVEVRQVDIHVTYLDPDTAKKGRTVL